MKQAVFSALGAYPDRCRSRARNYPGGYVCRGFCCMSACGELLVDGAFSCHRPSHLHWQLGEYTRAPRSCHKRSARGGRARNSGLTPMSFGRTWIGFLSNVSDCCRNAIRLRQTDISYSAPTLSEGLSGWAAPVTRGVNLACSSHDEEPVKRFAGNVRHGADNTGFDEMQRLHWNFGSSKKSETRKHRIRQG